MGEKSKYKVGKNKSGPAIRYPIRNCEYIFILI